MARFEAQTGQTDAAIRRLKTSLSVIGQSTPQTIAMHGQLARLEEQAAKAEYYAKLTEKIDLSMPESIEFYEFKVEEAKAKHEGIKNGSIPRQHSFDLPYANKAVKEAEKNLTLAKRLWA